MKFYTYRRLGRQRAHWRSSRLTKDKLGSGGAKANHAFREPGKLLESQSLEDGCVERDSRRKVGLGDVEENVSDGHFAG